MGNLVFLLLVIKFGAVPISVETDSTKNSVVYMSVSEITRMIQ